MSCCARVMFLPGILAAGVFLVGSLGVTETGSVVPTPAQEDPRQIIDVFAGIEAGSIEVRVIPRNEKHLNLLLKNKTPGPVTVSLPAAMAAVPVLAQFDQFPWPDFNQEQGRQQPQNVGLAPPWQGPQVGPGPMNLPGGGPWNIPNRGLWSIPPEKVAKVPLAGVCLNHGLPIPRPKMTYELRPIDAVANRPELAAICIMLGKGEISQVTAQLAAWHFQDAMSWDDLAAQCDKATIGTVPTYTRQEIRAAKRAAKEAKRLAEQLQPVPSSVSVR